MQIQLREQITEYFSKSELKDLCFVMGIKYEDLHGETITEKARELITFCLRHGQLQALVQQCRQLRPHVTWPSTDDGLEPIKQELQSSLNLTDDPQSQLEALQAGVEQLETSLERQYFLYHQLKKLTNDDVCRAKALALLKKLERHPKLFADVSREVTAFLSQIHQDTSFAKPTNPGPALQKEVPSQTPLVVSPEAGWATANLNINRLSSFNGVAVRFQVHLDNELIGTISNGEQASFPIRTGHHSLQFSGGFLFPSDIVEFDVIAYQTIEFTIKPGGFLGQKIVFVN